MRTSTECVRLWTKCFGEDNFVSLIDYTKTTGFSGQFLSSVSDYIVWYGKNVERLKYRALYDEKQAGEEGATKYREIKNIRSTFSLPLEGTRLATSDQLTSQGASPQSDQHFQYRDQSWYPPSGLHWKTTIQGMERLNKASRVIQEGRSVRYLRFIDDFAAVPRINVWLDIGGVQSRTDPKVYVVQTANEAIKRCILMTTDPGDLVLDPTCGSGTAAYVAEQWGRRWITIDTSRVALALARTRIMGARYPYYLLADSREGQLKEAELSRRAPSEMPTYGNVRQGFVYQRVPHITLRDIANNTEIDVIWEEYQEKLEPLREELNRSLDQDWEEWEIPREAGDPWTGIAAESWHLLQHYDDASDILKLLSNINRALHRDYRSKADVPSQPRDPWDPAATQLHEEWWKLRIARQNEIDASIAARAEYEYLYDKPYEDRSKVRVAGPFTVESISPHRVLGVDENGDVIDSVAEPRNGYGTGYDFGQIILENLKRSGVQQAHKEDRITFTSLTPWPGRLVCAEGKYSEEWIVESEEPGTESEDDKLTTNHSPLSTEKRAAIFIGPEFGTVSRPDLVEAAREAAECGFDVLIACAFNYDAHTTEFESLGRIPVLKARMNADLHMAGELKNTGNGNLFVIFGEPDISVASEEWLVDSLGNRIAPYDIFKLVSGTGSLAEINRLDGQDLRDYAAISLRREIWDYLANAAGRVLDTGEHRGRAGQAHDGGVSTVAWRCAGLPGGTGDLSDLIRKAGNDIEQGFSDLVELLRRDKQDAQWLDAVALHSPLTTGHWTQVTVHGVDVFHPNTGEVRSDGPEGIACWFIDTDYNQESFFVRHAYFLGANDPYKSLKTTLKAEIDADAWATLNRADSRPFPRPESGRIAVKVINHLGDEVMKVFRVDH